MMNEQAKEKYRERHRSVCVVVNGESQHLLQLKQPLCFGECISDNLECETQDGDYALLLEEWMVPSDVYDDILERWPYPKEAHLIPKGWAEARRLCISVDAEDRSHILYINRDAYTDRLVIARVTR